ncbi:MAG: FAD:protein FMN transferase [Clostridia bacterium]
MTKLKKKLYYLVLTTLLIACACVSLTGCAKKQKIAPNGENYTNYTAKVFNCSDYFNTPTKMLLSYDFTYEQEVERAKKTWEEVKEKLAVVDNFLSVDKERSDIFKFNQLAGGERLQVSELTAFAFEKAMEMYEFTDKKFNPSVFPLVDLWGFSPRFNKTDYTPTKPYDRVDFATTLPDSAYITAFTQLTKFENIKLEKVDHCYFLVKPDDCVTVNGEKYYMQIDLGGIGKGYAVDLANEIIKENGYNFGYISVGTSSLAVNQSPNIANFSDDKLDWSIDINHPRKDGAYLNIFDNNVCVSTSGDYEKYYTIDGKSYCHMIDAETGYPTRTGICTATVVCGSAIESDAITTALCLMTKEQANKFVGAKLADKKVVYLIDNGDTLELHTNMSQKEYKLTDKKIKLK